MLGRTWHARTMGRIRRVIVRRIGVATAIAMLATTATGCALLDPPSPTTTVTDAEGQEVTLSWADYPSDGSTDPVEVLAAPRAEQVDAVGEALLAELQRAVDAELPGLDWQRETEGGVHVQDGNGYGGATLLRTYNSADVSAADAPADWPALAAAIDAELAEQGYDAIEWEFDREPFGHETPAERDAAVVEQFGSLDPARMWHWSGSARNGAMWVSVLLQDVDRGVGSPADSAASSPQLLHFMVGGTVLATADERAYRDGIAPFDGLEPPEATHS